MGVGPSEFSLGISGGVRILPEPSWQLGISNINTLSVLSLLVHRAGLSATRDRSKAGEGGRWVKRVKRHRLPVIK